MIAKNIILVVAFLSISFCAIAQMTLNVETGYIYGKKWYFSTDFKGNDEVKEFPVNGMNIMLGVEHSLTKRIGLTAGFEFSNVKFNSILLSTIPTIGFQLPTYTKTEIIENRMSLKSGLVIKVVQKKKLTWKMMSLANIYYSREFSNQNQIFSNHKFAFGQTLKNSLQYRCAENIQFLFSQAYDLNSVFSGDENRFIFNVGVAYDLD